MRNQSGSITKLDDNRYRVSVELPTINGKRKRASRVVRGTYHDAEIALAQLKLDNAQHVDRHRAWTVGEFWQAVYLPTLDHLKPRTKSGYISDYTRLVEPLFSPVELDSLTPSFIERQLWTIESPGSQRAAFKLLRQIVNYAYGEQHTDNNPFLRHIRLKPLPKKPIRTYTPDEQRTLLDAMRGEHIEPVILAMLCGGLRVEEACALYWRDLSFRDGRCYISIDKAYLLVDNKPVEQPTTKTTDSKRIAVISGYAAQRLGAIRADLRPGLSTPLVSNRKGARMRPDVIRARYNVIVERAGLPRDVPLKNLRHTFASSLHALDIPDAAISHALGHDNLSTAYNHYLAAEVAQFERLADLHAQDVTRCNTKPPTVDMNALYKTMLDLVQLLARPEGLEPSTVGLEVDKSDDSPGQTQAENAENGQE